MKSFVLPGGTPAAAHLHVRRTVCRRAERLAIAVRRGPQRRGRALPEPALDLLFILSRGANQAAGAEEPLWEPGRYR